MENIPEMISTFLTEAVGSEVYTYQKPFPYKAVVTKDSIPGKLVSEGFPWTIDIYSTDSPFPEEVFKKMDLHGRAKESYYLGWIGGSYTKGVKDEKTGRWKRGGVPALFIDELQSDLMQRTMEMATRAKYQSGAYKRIRDVSSEMADLIDKLEQLEQDFPESQAYYPLKKKLEIEQRKAEIKNKIGKEMLRVDKEPALPTMGRFRSKLENYFKRYVDAFMNAALDYAKDLDSYFIYLIGPERFGGEFGFIYSAMAKKYGMKRSRVMPGWYVGRLDQMVSERIVEAIDPPEQWRAHLETYIKTFLKQEGVDLDDYEVGSYERDEAFKHAFSFWLDEVGEDMLSDSIWRRSVENFVQEKYQVDISDVWPPDYSEFSDEDEELHRMIQDIDLDDMGDNDE